jgi:Ser/Thr protein kinase RdoA (MazF antagonist)
VLLPWRVPIWRVGRDGTRAILRRSRIDALFSSEDLRWQHRVQRSLAERDLRVPLPIAAFNAETAIVEGQWAWELLTYLPGRPLAWQSQPTLRDVSALIGGD